MTKTKLACWKRVDSASPMAHVVTEHPDQDARWHWTCGAHTYCRSYCYRESCFCGVPLVYPDAAPATGMGEQGELLERQEYRP